MRVIEIAPGMVRTEEFSLNRLGSQEAADRVYEGVAQPLVAEDVAEAIVWTLERPSHVNIDSMIVRRWHRRRTPSWRGILPERSTAVS